MHRVHQKTQQMYILNKTRHKKYFIHRVKYVIKLHFIYNNLLLDFVK